MMQRLLIFFLLGVSVLARGDAAQGNGCDWALETMSMRRLDEIHDTLDEQDRMVYLSMFDTIEVEMGKGCSSGGVSICTGIAIINRKTGRVKMAHLAGQQPTEASEFIRSSLADLGGPDYAKHLQVVMAGNQTAVTRAHPDYKKFRESSEQFENALRDQLAAGGVATNQIRSFLSSEPEQYVYDLTVDTKTKKIYVARKKVALRSKGNDPFQ